VYIGLICVDSEKIPVSPQKTLFTIEQLGKLVYVGLFWGYTWLFSASIGVFCGQHMVLFGVYRARLQMHMALFSVCRALLRIHMALSSVYRALLRTTHATF